MATIQQQEKIQQSVLNAMQNRKYKQEFRGDLLKAGAIKGANQQLGEKVGASVGGTVGSIIPFFGTGIGIFLGRFIGKKLGITGFIIIALLAVLFQAILFILVLKGYCDSLGYLGQAADYLTIGICQNFK